jgi:hypothetical protein
MYALNVVALPNMVQRMKGRRLVAMDIENINGGAVNDKTRASAAWREVRDAIALSGGEQVVVGVGPSSLLASGMGLSGARMVMGRGLSGADRALVEVLQDENIARRFGEVVIASGDGIFSDVAAELGSQGVNVTVVARYGHLSARLRLAAARVVLLPDFESTFGEAA